MLPAFLYQSSFVLILSHRVVLKTENSCGDVETMNSQMSSALPTDCVEEFGLKWE